MAKKSKGKPKAAPKTITVDDQVESAKAVTEIAKPKPKPCTRCGGDGVFHSTKTGVRAKTSAEPLVDPSRVCPKCKGEGTI